MNEASTQQFIDIAGIKEGIIILKNGGYRMIFSISAINFSLKSEEEQNSLIFQYQSFLNSLHFPIQVVMRSKKLDLNPYIRKINEIKEKQTSELVKMQTEDYLDFITQLINMANIMKKTFYVVIPYDPVTVKSPSIIDKLFKKSEPASLKVSSTEFKRYKEELTERANTVANGLGSMGLHCVQLSTEEIIELFYKIYNPEIADKERFSKVEELTSAYVADVKERKDEKNAQSENNKEEIIDNSGIVEEKNKQELQMKEMAAQNQADRQIAANEPPPKNEKINNNDQATASPPNNSQAPQQPPANNLGNDIHYAQQPVQSDQTNAASPTEPPQK